MGEDLTPVDMIDGMDVTDHMDGEFETAPPTDQLNDDKLDFEQPPPDVPCPMVDAMESGILINPKTNPENMTQCKDQIKADVPDHVDEMKMETTPPSEDIN